MKDAKKGGTEADSGTGAIVSSAAVIGAVHRSFGSLSITIIAVDKGMGN